MNLNKKLILEYGILVLFVASLLPFVVYDFLVRPTAILRIDEIGSIFAMITSLLLWVGVIVVMKMMDVDSTGRMKSILFTALLIYWPTSAFFYHLSPDLFYEYIGLDPAEAGSHLALSDHMFDGFILRNIIPMCIAFIIVSTLMYLKSKKMLIWHFIVTAVGVILFEKIFVYCFWVYSFRYIAYK